MGLPKGGTQMATEHQPDSSLEITRKQPPLPQTPETMRRELEAQRQSSARLLNELGSAIRSSAGTVKDKAGDGMAWAARRAGHAAQYVQDRYLRDNAADLGRLIRRHPGSSLVVAAVAGYVFGRVLRRR